MTTQRESNEGLSQVRPVLTGPVLCDLAARDPSSGKWNLIGIFNQLGAARFPTQRPLSVYLKLSDAQGNYRLEIRFVQVSTGSQLAVASANLQIKDWLASQDIAASFPRIPIPMAGEYAFQVWANGMHLVAGALAASQISPPQSALPEQRGAWRLQPRAKSSSRRAGSS